MGHEINSAGAWFASVTIDKQYLFFNSWKPGDQGYNPYWISAAIIDSLRLIVGISEPVKSSVHFILHQNSPNPFRDQTMISFEIVAPTAVTIEITSSMGIPVKSVVQKQLYQSGKHMIMFDGSDLQPGVYLSILKGEGVKPEMKKMILIH